MILKLMILPKQKYMRILNIAFQSILKIFMELLILYYLLKIQKVTISLLIFLGLDSNNEIRHSNIDIDKNIKLMNMPSMSDKWDIVHFEQLMWYWNSSKELEDYCGNIINGILFMHIPPWEFQYIVDNPIVTKCTGSTKEIMKIGMLNSGLFSTILQRKDIICIACGHSHNDCFEGTFCNVKMCLDACAGYSPYGTDDLRGGRIFEINENDTNDIKTYMVHYKDLK